ncbi:GNAT family N-acetyltransferase [Nesterenkonia sp. F]|uniref:GNAT family N-acetyltransferase n=1 Tax=Nesterenkonia sp. F TaxID=795955 RepID=UPI0003061225|nr:GNAT family N-acetyltransferase [Nesterenkonia sp. F]
MMPLTTAVPEAAERSEGAAPAPTPRPEELTFTPVEPDADAATVTAWLAHPASVFWQMGHLSVDQVRDHLTELSEDDAQSGWVIREHGEPLAYAETYDPARVLLDEVFAAREGDIGMHLLVAPPPAGSGARRPGLTSAIMRAVVDHCFQALGARRIVVEPDVGNAAVAAKNAEVGFEVLREVDLPGKRAALSVLDAERARAVRAQGPEPAGAAAQVPHLRPEHLESAQRHLVAKALAEFSHERLIVPEPDGAAERWVLDTVASRWRFAARRFALHHWAVDESSLVREDAEGADLPLDAQQLVIELHQALEIPDDLLGTYLEELASTLASAAYKHHRGGPSAAQLARGRTDVDVAADFQQTEAVMTEGHPSFVATNGRIGFGLEEFGAYAPETGRTFRHVWLAARREHTLLSTAEGLGEEAHYAAELDAETRERFVARLAALGLDPRDYLWLPVHPWQFQHRVAVSFAPELARRDLVVLGEGGDEHQPQQSIRTGFSRTAPERSYVKTALSIQNMGFLRGLSPAYMRATPAVNDWVAAEVRGDAFLRGAGFEVLREHAAIGFTGDAYHRSPVGSDQQKMLAALWRESPLPQLPAGQRLMTLAALLHRDDAGASAAAALIARSGLTAADWLAELLRAYLLPVVHCLEVHELAFMPHGENLILRLDAGRVVGAFMKDIGEEAAVVGHRELPAEIERIRHVVDDAEAAQVIFTDVFDGVLRHLAALLAVDGVLEEEGFWATVSAVLAEHEGLDLRRRRRLDLRVPDFVHHCLNRLQLRNTRQMVDLQDASGSMIRAGRLENPVAG